MKCASLKVGLNKYSLDTVRYAAYSVTDKARVLIRKKGKSSVEIEIHPKEGFGISEIKKLLLSELEDEKFRERILAQNSSLREFLFLKALSSDYQTPREAGREDDDGLTPEQEKELEQLIKEVEEEIKKEKKTGKNLRGIDKTWEEKYGKN